MAPKAVVAPRGSSKGPRGTAKPAAPKATALKPKPALQSTSTKTQSEAHAALSAVGPELHIAPPAAAPEAPPLESMWGLDVPEAEKLLRGLEDCDLAILADSVLPEEQLPARYALEFVGDKDFSWANAQTSLRTGQTFIKEMLDMEGGSFITKKSLERYEKLGEFDRKALGAAKNKAGLVLALYLDACIRSAKSLLGLDVPPPMPSAHEEPPPWPMSVPFTEIPQCILEANKWGKSALLVCKGHAREVDTFFTYQSCSTIDAKWLLSECVLKKTMSVEDAREQLRQRVVSGMKYGQPLHIAMSNSAVDIKGTYCAEGLFPEALFKNELFHRDNLYKTLIREADLADWPGAFPGRKKSECFSFVTTDFDLDSAKEYLPKVLPHFEDLAIYEVDPASFNDK